MATNPPAGDGQCNGAVKKRSRLETKIDGETHFTKREKETGEFMANNEREKFKGVRTEHT